MQKNITDEEYYSDKAAKGILEFLESKEDELELKDSVIYYNFPMFKELDDELQYPSLCIVSRNYGVILVVTDNKLEREINEEHLEKIDDKLSQLYSLIHAKLFKVKNLKKNKKSLKFELNTFQFTPNYKKVINLELENDFASSFKEVEMFLTKVRSLNEKMETDTFKLITSILEGSAGIVKPEERNFDETKKLSKGKVLVELEKEINNLDKQQKFAALTQINGPQRIRGLAGSGKTVILCMKAANILMKNPDAKILYTFYTKSLYEHIKLLISRFYRVYSEKDPNFKDSIHVRHAWGGKNINGVYYDACKENRIRPLPLSEAIGNNKFDYVCKDLLDRTKGNLTKEYDYVLMDEAQDFSPSFYWICRKITKNDNLVWAYDQLQNILDVNIQDTKTLFKNEYGDDGLDLECLLKAHPELNNDIVLPVCYRNPRESLILAHSIGFGIYNKPIIQMLENIEHWIDNGYQVIQGTCKEGEDTIITRDEHNSPLSISKKYGIKEIIEPYKADDVDDEVQWIVTSIKENLEEGLLPHDIMIICLDQGSIGVYIRKLSYALNIEKIFLNNTLEAYNNEFWRDNCITFTSVFKAKGNESALVYVIGCDVFSSHKDDIIMRNKIFTCFTRSKAWLKITGIGVDFSCLEDEINKTMEKYPNLEFKYPNKLDVKSHQRDLSKANSTKEQLVMLIKEFSIKNGIFLEDAIEIVKDEFNVNGVIKK